MLTAASLRFVAVEWGDISSWVSAVATFFALIFAAIAALAARRAYRIETERDRQQAAFLRRSQAALVSAWWGRHDAGGGDPRWGAFVRNASETPVYQATLSVVNVRDPDASHQLDLAVVPPDAEPLFVPGQVEPASGTAPDAALDYRVGMSFSDSTGLRWIRDQRGVLSEVSPELTIWADTQRTSTLDRFTESFLTSHQVQVEFRTLPIETLRRGFLDAVRSGEAPADVLVGPHDWIGNLVDRGTIQPIALSGERRAAFVERQIEAMTYRGQLYGVPYASDSIALLRNLDLAPDPPATVEELLEEGRAICRARRAREPMALQVGTGDGFYVYPLFTSAGGRLFVRADGGGWDADVIAGPGSAAAFARLGALGEQGEGVLRRAIDREAAMAMFAGGQTPFLVCAAWGVGEARDAGVRVGVSPVPPFADAGPARSLVATHGLFLAASARNRIIAQDLVADYMTRAEVAEALYASQPRTPALWSALRRVLERDPMSAVYHEQCQAGDIIPSGADAVTMWTIFHRAEADVVAGADVDAVMRRLHHSIVELNRTLAGGRAR